jgi:hypothetical protein
MSQIYVLHENDSWVEPLREAFAGLGLPHEEWFLGEGSVPFDRPPPDGVFYNRMSASSHTRGHRYGPELTHGVLNWLEAYGRRVVNSSRALYLEVSKLAQYAALRRTGIAVPRTVAATGRDNVLAATKSFGPGPYILKPNRGGKGLGVQLFQSFDAVADYLDSPRAVEEAPIDGLWLIQEYLRAPQPFITRCEFVGGRFLYAVRVDTSDGFELCPADACAIDGEACPAEAPSGNKFTVLPGFQHPILDRYSLFLRDNEIEVAGIEFIVNEAGQTYTYDVNTNTNYNAQAEAVAGIEMTGMKAVAGFLGEELAKTQTAVSAVAAE